MDSKTYEVLQLRLLIAETHLLPASYTSDKNCRQARQTELQIACRSGTFEQGIRPIYLNKQ